MARATFDSGGGPVATSWTAEDRGEQFDRRTIQPGDLTLTGAARATLDEWCSVDGPTSVPVVGQGI